MSNSKQALKNLSMKVHLLAECLLLLKEKLHEPLEGDTEYGILCEYLLQAAYDAASGDIWDDIAAVEREIFGKAENLYLGGVIIVPKGLEVKSIGVENQSEGVQS